MPNLQNGEFTTSIETADLAKGLRWTRRNPRNSKFLTQASGAIGYDGVLQALVDITGDYIDISSLSGVEFPFPQLFLYTNLIILATQTDIYEVTPTTKTLSASKITVSPGILWSAVDLNDYIYMSNGVVAIERGAFSREWSLSTTLPVAGAICNFNGQIVVGAPDVIQAAL